MLSSALVGGFLEAVYQGCLSIEFRRVEIPFAEQVDIWIRYRWEKIEQVYRAEFVGFDKIVLEIKAVESLAPSHESQGAQLPERNRF